MSLFIYMSILSQFLRKQGVDDAAQLTQEERVVYDNYKRILDAPEKLTVDDIKEFCEQQVSMIENRWRSLEDESKKAALIPYHTCYKVIIQAIDAPQLERANLEKYLNNVLNK